MLVKFFGPHRALTIHAFIYRWGALIVVVPIFLIGMYIVQQYAGQKHEHVAFIRGNVLFSTTEASETSGFSSRFIVRLPEGEKVVVHTDSGVISSSVVKTACLEKRRYVETGKFRYRLVPQRKCAD